MYVKVGVTAEYYGGTYYLRQARGRWVVEDDDGLTDWPICYDDGRVAYDHPERLPEPVRRAFSAIIGAAERLEWLSRLTEVAS